MNLSQETLQGLLAKLVLMAISKLSDYVQVTLRRVHSQETTAS